MELYEELISEYRSNMEKLLRKIECHMLGSRFEPETFHALINTLIRAQLVSSDELQELAGFNTGKLAAWLTDESECPSGPIGQAVLRVLLTIAQERLNPLPVPKPAWKTE